MNVSGPSSPIGSPRAASPVNKKQRAASPTADVAASVLKLTPSETTKVAALDKAIATKKAQGKEIAKIFNAAIKGGEDFGKILKASSKPTKVAEILKEQLYDQIGTAIEKEDAGQVKELIQQLHIVQPDLDVEKFKEPLMLEDEQVEFGVKILQAYLEKHAVTTSKSQNTDRLHAHLDALLQLPEKTALTASEKMKIALFVEENQSRTGYISTKESGLPRALILDKGGFVVLSKHAGVFDKEGAERKVSAATFIRYDDTTKKASLDKSFVRLVNITEDLKKSEAKEDVVRTKQQVALANLINPGDIVMVVEHTSKKGKEKISIIEKMYPHTLGDEKLGLVQKKELLLQVAKSVQKMHEMGYVHADIKRENVVYGDDGHAKLTDFGASYNNKPDGIMKDEELLKNGYGTDRYTAPEYFTNDAKVGFAEDRFALGCLFYELLHDSQTPWAPTINRVVPNPTESGKEEALAQIKKNLQELDTEIAGCSDPTKKNLLEITRGLLEMNLASRLEIGAVVRRMMS